ncbi:MAG TPA: SDR family oxidoreductase [Candidatus Methylacidiphilales bacterium]|nr:SDR family oxidoreductase [Candidatus Methylacidiphilales bacterium]
MNVVITGASLGLGRAIAEAFARNGAHLLLCARTPGPLEEAALELRKIAGPDRKILWKACDVSDEGQVKALSSLALAELGGCDVLINNAGIHGAKGPLEEVSWEEWRRTIEIDLFGVILPCRCFIPHMKKAGCGRIINLSGGGATGPRPFFSAYAAAKAAVVRVTETLAEELRSHHIQVNAVAPGPVNTRLVAEAVAAGPEKIGPKAYVEMLRITQGGDRPPELAAELCLFLAGPESEGITGKLISAPWDPWRNLAAHRAELAATDIYTLRRIVPEDRGKKWESLE